jgi:predicted HAD superfamily Cof-like phosphohydrolase
MEIHELTPEQEKIADVLCLAFDALVKHGMPVDEVAHIVVDAAIETEELLAV